MELSRDVFQEFSLDWDFAMGEAASEEEINDFEEVLGLPLSASYREFLLKYNGAHLFCSASRTPTNLNSPWTDSGILVFGLQALQDYNQEIAYAITELEDALGSFTILPVAYLGRVLTGDFCAINMDTMIEGENPVLECDHERLPSEWKDAQIAVSFEDWLQKMFDRIIEHKSLPEYWFEDTLHDNSLADLAELDDWNGEDHTSPPGYWMEGV